jgi:ABC-type polysaccharide/polyol phosphate export permease/Tfp pilus assembly protein PilF
MTDATLNFNQLKEHLTEVIARVREDLRNAPALIAVAEQFLKSHYAEQAATIAHRAVEVAPNDARVLRGASGILAGMDEHHFCATLCERAVELNPGNSELRLHYAVILLELRENHKAINQLEAHLAFEPESAMGWRNISSALCNIGEFTRGLGAIDKAIKLDPYNIEFRIHRAGLENHLGMVGQALADLRYAEAEAPDNATVRWLTSVVFENAGDADAALVNAQIAHEMAPHNLEFAGHYERLQERFGRIRETLDRLDVSARTREEQLTRRALPRLPRRQTMHSPWVQAVIHQNRIIFALLLREMKTRFGETKLGYGWALVEPISHLALLAVVFSTLNRGLPPIGDSLLVYYFTGVLPYLTFSNTIMHVQFGIEANRNLLQIPMVTNVDVFFARGLLEFVTQLTVGAVMLTVFYLIGLPSVPNQVEICFTAMFFVWCFGFGIGICNAVMIHFFKSWDHLFANVVRALYFTSGIFYSPLMMPDWIRDILAWNPLLQGVDWFRSGFYSIYEPNWLDRGYVVVWAIGILMLGLGMERSLRRKLTVQ